MHRDRHPRSGDGARNIPCAPLLLEPPHPLHMKNCKPMVHGREGAMQRCKIALSRHHPDKDDAQIAPTPMPHQPRPARQNMLDRIIVFSLAAHALQAAILYLDTAAGSARPDGRRRDCAGGMAKIKEKQDASSLAHVDGGAARLRHHRGPLAALLGRGTYPAPGGAGKCRSAATGMPPDPCREGFARQRLSDLCAGTAPADGRPAASLGQVAAETPGAAMAERARLPGGPRAPRQQKPQCPAARGCRPVRQGARRRQGLAARAPKPSMARSPRPSRRSSTGTGRRYRPVRPSAPMRASRAASSRLSRHSPDHQSFNNLGVDHDESREQRGVRTFEAFPAAASALRSP